MPTKQKQPTPFELRFNAPYCEYVYIGEYHEGKAIARIDERNQELFCHIGFDGKPAYRWRYKAVNDFVEGLAAVTVTNDLGYHIQHNGEPAYKEQFTFVNSFKEGLARVRTGKEMYHIRHDGTPAYPDRFESVSDFEEGLAVVTTFDGLDYHIRHDGKPAYDPKRFKVVSTFNNGRAWVNYIEGGYTHCGYIDHHGNLIRDEE